MEEKIKNIEVRFYGQDKDWKVSVDGDYPTPFSPPEPYWGSFLGKGKDIRPELEAPFGKALCDRVFNSERQNRLIKTLDSLTTNQSLNFSLMADDPKIHEIPWELLNIDGTAQGFLLKKGNISITHARPGITSHLPPARPPFKVLIVVSLPLEVYENNPIDLLYELSVIYEALKEYKEIIEIDVLEKASFSKIRDKILKNQYHIIHFTGHGAPDGLLLENDEDYTRKRLLKGREIEELFQGLNVHALILDACHTATMSFDTSTALRAHKTGIPIVIANQSSVMDTLATRAIKDIYSSLFMDFPFKVLNSVRLNLKRQWWRPVIFSAIKPNEKIFKAHKIKKRIIPVCFKALGLYQKGTPFVYRFGPIRRLTEAMEASPYAILHGIGGAGKSTLADYIAEFLRGRFEHIVAIDLKAEGVRTIEELVEAITEEFINASVIDETIGDKILTEKRGMRKWQRLNEVLGNARWLLILDNFEQFQNEMGIIKDREWKRFLNELINNWSGQFLITTRLKVLLHERSPLENTIEIGTFSEAEFDFLLRQIEERESGEREKAREKIEYLKKNKDILEHYDFHPLFIRRFIDTRPKEIKVLLKDHEINNVLNFYKDYFEKYRGLKRLLLLDFPFSEGLLETILKGDLEAKDIIKNRLLILKKNGNYKIYSLIKEYLLGILDLGDEIKREVFEDKETKAKLIEELNRLGNFYYREKPDRAIKFLNEALKLGLGLFGEKHSSVATSYNNLGMAYHAKGDLDKAIGYYHKALEIWLGLFGERNHDVATSYNNLGSAYHDKKDLDKAINYYNKALKIWLDLKRHPDVATSYNNLGMAYHDKGDLDKAIGYYHKALEIWLEIFGERHHDVATSYNNLGGAYHAKGDLDKAIDYFNKALKIWLDLKRHPDVAYVALGYNNLGSAYHDKGDLNKAINYYNKALKIRLEIFGERHHDVATSYNNLGSAYRAKGDLDKAIGYHHKALEILLEIFGERHHDVATSYNNLGSAYHAKGDLNKAINYYYKALAVNETLRNETNEIIYYMQMAEKNLVLANLYKEKGKDKEAINYLCQGAEMIAETFHFVRAKELFPNLYFKQVLNLFFTAKALNVLDNPPDKCKESFERLKDLFERLKLLERKERRAEESI